MKYNCEIEAKDFKVNGESINKGLSVSETGTGNVITDVAVNGHNIMVTKGNVEITEETPLSITTDGEGNVVTGIAVNNHTITVTKGAVETSKETNVTITTEGVGNVISDLTVAGHSITAKKTTALTSSDLDNATIKLVDGKIVAETLNGLTVTVAELNNLQGLDFNVKEKFSSLGNAMSFFGVFNTKALLLAETTPTNGATAIVKEDEDNTGKQMTYVYVGTGEYSSSNWTEVAENSIQVRDFSVSPIDLGSEVTGQLPNDKVAGLSAVATSGSYNDLTDIPSVCLQLSEMPTEANTGAIVQYVGGTTESYTQGNFYQWNGTAWSKITLGEGSGGKGISGTGEKSEIFNNTENNIASGNYSHAEGSITRAEGYTSHAEGDSTIAEGNYSHAEGYGTHAFGLDSHTEGRFTVAEGRTSHAEGWSAKTTSLAEASHAEGLNTTASGSCSHVEGSGGTASGLCSHAEGDSTTASGDYSHAEGDSSQATGLGSHAEGSSIASGKYSHAEGSGSVAEGEDSHAEGCITSCRGFASHTEGKLTSVTSGAEAAHAEGWGSQANGTGSHAEGYYTVANGNYQHVFGKYNVEDSENKYVEIVGNGTGVVTNEVKDRKNIRTLDWSGNEVLAGSCTAKDFILSSGMSMTKPVTKKFTRNTTNCASIFSSNIECLGSLRVANIDMTSAIDFEPNKSYILATIADEAVRAKVNKGINIFTNRGVQCRLSIQSNGEIQLVPTANMAAGDGIRTLMVWIS